MATDHRTGGEPTPSRWRRLWPYGRALLAPVLIWLLLMGVLLQQGLGWLDTEDRYDRAVMQEWLDEARNADSTLSELVEGYVRRLQHYFALRHRLDQPEEVDDEQKRNDLLLYRSLAAQQVAVKRTEIYQHLRALAEPPTKMYPGQLPLFPVIYRLEVHLETGHFPPLQSDDHLPAYEEPIVWDSGLDPSSGQYRTAIFPLRSQGEANGRVMVRYQLRAWNKRQNDEEARVRRVRQLALLAIAATVLGVAWMMLVQSDERDRQRQREQAREALAEAQRHRLETERQLLEQKLATQAAERQALELKSHLYASIGIMAGSYAHNIKNLLVRPNDLLRRCLERGEVPGDEERMLREVQHTLGLVTERLQQILQTVRRDPSQSKLEVLDLNDIARGVSETWKELASDRWQLDLDLDLADQGGPLPFAGDASHLQQAVENLLFNARDATFEMRNHHREAARNAADLDRRGRQQALITAAAWRGKVVVRTRRGEGGGEAVLEVQDNGIGMTEDVRRRCTETHFSTKRDNALFAGHSTGMGLGLSFVVAILENHAAQLEITSQPLEGTTFRVRFPAA